MEQQLAKQAYQAWEAEDWSGAAAFLEQALQLSPDGPKSAGWWFDAALAHKFLRNWQRAYELGKQAAARAKRGEEDPAFWNLGIVATILRDWTVARDCWLGYGIPLADGEGEITEDFGSTCIRITTLTGQEVVWARRLCPTRARVMSVPFDSSRRFGEVVVHDGVPNGERITNGRRVAVFDELVLFEESDIETLSVSVTCTSPADTEALSDAFWEAGFGADAVSSAVVLCKCCSEGAVTQENGFDSGAQTVLLGAPEPEAVRLLSEWRTAAPDSREWTNLHVATR